ncbi:MAG: cytochrome c [Mariprofundaceae bacterium]|nr:cytochrome c [Mariprofundaceae bacterium]
MKKITTAIAAIATVALLSSPAFASDGVDGAKLFNKKCKMCHKMEKSRSAPAVQSMHTDASILSAKISNGGKGMPKFGHKFSEEEISALVKYIQSNTKK